MDPEIIFPNLNIKIAKINRVAFELFGIRVYWYGILIVFSIILGYFLIDRKLKKSGKSIDEYLTLIILCLVNSIICARIYYVIFSWNYYSKHLNEIILINNGGLAIYGGIIGILLTTIIYCKITKKNALQIFDIFIPYVALGQAIGRWGNFINKEAFGGYTNSFFTMAIRKDAMPYIPDALIGKEELINNVSYYKVHPTFLYESICSLILFTLLININKYAKLKEGDLLLIYLFVYSTYRFFIEGLRTDQLLIFSVPISQIVAITLMIISILIFTFRHRTKVTTKK